MMLSTLIAVLLAVPPASPQVRRPDAEGFLRHWLVLAPLEIQGDSGAAEIDREFFPGEGQVRPKADAPQQVGRWWYTWKAHETSDYYIDFLQSFGDLVGERVAAYAVTYVDAPADLRVTLAMGSNDQGKVWLNGTPVVSVPDSRGLEKDSNRVPVTLVQGRNVIVFKVINETNNWQGCLRFLGDGGAPVTNLTVVMAP